MPHVKKIATVLYGTSCFGPTFPEGVFSRLSEKDEGLLQRV